MKRVSVSSGKNRGSLVSRIHVVTAAHCVTERSPIMVRLGENNLSTEYDCLNVDERCEMEG